MMSAANGASRDMLSPLRLKLRANGYPPIPVAGPQVRCRSPGKQPLMRDWRAICATADEAEIRRWAVAEPGCTNTGILCDAVAGVDIDVPVPDLAAQIEAEAVAKLGRTPLRRVGRAPKVLLVYRNATALPKMETPELFLPDGTKVQVEILGRGQQFVAYGIHPDTGRDYEWTESGPDVVPLADLLEVSEDALRAFRAAAEAILRAAGGLTRDEREKAEKPAAGGGDEPEHGRTASSSTNSSSSPRSGAGGDTFFRQVNQAALNNLDAWVPKVFSRAQRQATGAYRVSSADLGRAFEEDLSIHPTGVQDFGPRRGLSPCDVLMEFGGAPSVQEAAFKLCEFLSRAPADFGWKEAGRSKKAKAGKRTPDADASTEQKSTQNAQDDDLAGTGLTEDEVALSFAETHHKRVVYDHTDVGWYCWSGDRWARDDTNLAFDLVRRHVRAIREAQAEPPRSLGKIAFFVSVERAARADRRIVVSHSVWDRNSWILGVPGGVVDLKNGQVRPGNPAEFVSRQTLVAPAPEGTGAPLWTKFLQDATRDDAAVISFLQRLAGYILTGEVSEEILCFLYGSGGNGKGVFIGTLVSILNDYAVAVPIDAFTASSRLNGEYYRAQMAGSRLVTASETEAGATWAESQIKELTGNEAPLSARNPHGRPFTYRPQFKLAIVGNHAPRLKGRSPAMERRLRIVPFTHAPQHPDPDLKDKLRAEYPAILRWMIEGCLEWQQFRLGTAPTIAAATSDYFEQQDGFRRWIDERCILDATLQTKPGVLFADFKTWCTANGEEAPNANEFAELADRMPGIKRFRSNGVRWAKGIGLKTERPSGRHSDDRSDYQ